MSNEKSLANVAGSNSALGADGLLAALIMAGYGLSPSARQVKKYFPDVTADGMCKLIVDQPTAQGGKFTREEAKDALNACGYLAQEVETALAKYYYPPKYALKTNQTSYLSAPPNNAYKFGEGDFAIETWFKSKSQGALISCKVAPGGVNNGGFLLILYSSGEIRFTTDDGIGHYEIVSERRTTLDNKWHHITAVRESGKLSIYLDFMEIPSTVHTRRFTPLNVNNNSNLTLAYTEQGAYWHYTECLHDARIWNTAKKYGSLADYNSENLTGNEPNLVGWWNFQNKDGTDLSKTKNHMSPVSGTVEYIAVE